jgi:hypothetical protein
MGIKSDFFCDEEKAVNRVNAWFATFEFKFTHGKSIQKKYFLHSLWYKQQSFLAGIFLLYQFRH